MYINPYNSITQGANLWLKSNFHIHAGTGKGTCGSLGIDEVIDFYKTAGYDVLTISNHDIYSDVSEYESKYDILLLNGFEYSQDKHMLCIDGKNVITGSHQNVINKCSEQGGFSILCHPNWKNEQYWSLDNINTLKGYTGIEIYNGVIFTLSGSGLATDKWDILLSQGKLAWGFGSDDFHKWFDMARAWNMIYSVKDRQSVRNSISKGAFYISTGLTMNEFIFKDNTIRISVKAKDTYIKSNKYIFIGENGSILDEQYGESGEYVLQGNELYIRVQAISEHGAMLWTQPVYEESKFRVP